MFFSWASDWLLGLFLASDWLLGGFLASDWLFIYFSSLGCCFFLGFWLAVGFYWLLIGCVVFFLADWWDIFPGSWLAGFFLASDWLMEYFFLASDWLLGFLSWLLIGYWIFLPIFRLAVMILSWLLIGWCNIFSWLLIGCYIFFLAGLWDIFSWFLIGWWNIFYWLLISSCFLLASDWLVLVEKYGRDFFGYMIFSCLLIGWYDFFLAGHRLSIWPTVDSVKVKKNSS